MVRFDSEQEARDMVKKFKEAGVSPAHIRVYEWRDVVVDGEFRLLEYRSRYGVAIIQRRCQGNIN